MKIWPVGLQLKHRLCLVVGAGAEVEERAAALLRCGAFVRVVSERPQEALGQLGASDKLDLHQRPFEEADLDGCWLVVAADSPPSVAERLSRLCEARRIWFCAVDQPDLSSFFHLAIARAGSLSIAVGTEGQVPALSRWLRRELQRLLDESRFEQAVDQLAKLRAATSGDARRKALAQAMQRIRLDGQLRWRT